MIKTGLSRVFSAAFAVGKAAVFGVGLAVVLALGLGVATTALAAEPGDPFLLGRINKIGGALTRLVGDRPSPLLQVNNAGGPALNLVVPAGNAPLLVSAGSARVANLDADKLDGQDAAAFLPAGGKAADADQLDGLDSSRFMPGTTFRAENSPPSTGTALGDGTRFIDVACPAGSRLLSGGMANIDVGTIVLESFPGNANNWRTRIQNNSTLDAFSTVVLCARF